jgi:hypothetical protein
VTGQTVEIEIAPRLAFGLLAADVGSMLRAQFAKIREPSHFFLLNESLADGDAVGDEHALTRYRTALAFVQTLRRAAAFLDQDEPALVFIADGKFDIPIQYDEADLQAISMSAMQAMNSSLPEGVHEKQCLSILADAVVSLTSPLPPDVRFRHLLANVAELKERFDRGYELFAAGFSYEKIRDEIEAARVEYAGKIHKVFSDIQNQLLGIPVATIVVATQMKDHQAIDASFWTSVAVLLGSFVFAILMHFLLRNQRHTLEVIGIEIRRQKSKLEKEHAAVAPNFTETFQSLDRRYKTQRVVLFVVDAVVVLGFLLSVFFFYKLSGPARVWLATIL